MAAENQALVDIISEFCELIENHQRRSPAEVLQQAHVLLPLLYYRMLLTPEVELAGVGRFPRSITHEQWLELFTRLLEFLEPHHRYRIIYDPTILTDNEPVNGTLADDFADIWRDLKNGLMHWHTATDTQRLGILYDWQVTFRNHWSLHVVDALRALNWLLHHGVAGPSWEPDPNEDDEHEF
jgi:hypothetical protein